MSPLEGARERRVRSGEVELCVAELGDPGRPTVVLVHGYPDSKEVWSEVAGRLRDRFHVVLYDVRGHGRSTAPRPLRGGFTLDKLTDDFLAVADAVSPDEPVHLVGHDWGSVQSWEFVTVARAEGRIASFTSMSGPSLDHFGHWINSRLSRPTPRRVGQLLGQGAKSWYVGVLHTPALPELAWRGPLGKRWPKLLQRLEQVPAGDYPTASLPQDAAHGAWLYRDNVRTRLRRPRPDARAHAPVQLIVPAGDVFLSERLYDDLEQWVPHLVRRTLPARHWVPRTRPDRLADWITEFVDTVEDGRPASAAAAAATGRHADRFAGQLVLVT
ncbi:alpha/beta fold hydrolase, partial [Streptomyces sp. SID625]|nr:alpha/beta fold hydrolase [Streptomyces sp. SID625]